MKLFLPPVFSRLCHHTRPVGLRRHTKPCWGAVCLGLMFFLVGCSTTFPANETPVAPEAVDKTNAELEALPALNPARKSRPPSVASVAVLSWDEAIQVLAADLQGEFAASGEEPASWVAEPFVNGLTGAQSAATRTMTDRVAAWWRAQVPRADPWPFTPQAVSKARWWLMGSITPAEVSRQQQAPIPAWRLCVALADVQSGLVIAKAIAFASSQGVNSEPSPFYRDAPLAINDSAVATRDRRCQALRPGEILPKSYLARLTASPSIHAGIQWYDSGSPSQALRQFELALQSPAGHQFRSHLGVYLAQVRLRQHQAARQSFVTLVDHGIDQGDFSLSLVFRSGSTAVLNQARPGPEGDRLRIIAERLSKRLTCAEITVAAVKPAAIGARLATLRAEQIRRKLVQAQPVLDKRLRVAEPEWMQIETQAIKKSIAGASSEPSTVRFRSIDCY
jgi:hypothetical protein